MKRHCRLYRESHRNLHFDWETILTNHFFEAFIFEEFIKHLHCAVAAETESFEDSEEAFESEGERVREPEEAFDILLYVLVDGGVDILFV